MSVFARRTKGWMDGWCIVLADCVRVCVHGSQKTLDARSAEPCGGRGLWNVVLAGRSGGVDVHISITKMTHMLYILLIKYAL